MPEQVQKPKQETEKAETEQADSKDISKKGEEVKAEMDDLIDQIDDVLEENAAEFVKAFVQRGGE
jgi:ubiquitin-like protein Pup